MMQFGRSKHKRTAEEEEVANAEEYDVNDEGSESEEGGDGENDGIVDQFEAALAAKGTHIWLNGGAQKDVAIRVLIQCFGSMIESHAAPHAIPDFRGRIRAEEMEHRKLLDASKHVVKARQVLIKNENFDTRDFTIFIAQKKWVKNILRPLLELCAREDSALAMNCCSLALILVKKMSDRTAKLVDKFNRKKKKAKTITQDVDAEQKNADNEEGNNGNVTKKAETLHDSQSEEELSPNKLQNAKDQVLALLSFKDALCSELCNQAITNAFRECWVREQLVTSEETKLGAARCISYFRRILSISPHKEWSAPSEILEQRVIHNRYIVQLRVFLSLLPGIISDVRRSYHDDWLTDIVLILFYIFDNFKAQELFLVWKTNALMPNFLALSQETDLDPAVPSSETTNNNANNAMNSTGNSNNNVLASTPVVAPDALRRKMVSQALGATSGLGSLSSKLLGEKVNRERQAATAGGSARFARFTSTYQVPLYNNTSLENLSSVVQPSHQARKTSSSANANNSNNNNLVSVAVGGNNNNNANNSNNNNKNNDQQQQPVVDLLGDNTNMGGTKVITSSSIILKDPFASGKGDILPQVREKRNKKNLTFGQENDFLETSKQQAKLTEDGQRACIVVASLAEALTSDVCFKNFVRRINEDLRRDELRISPDMEWQYFSIVTKLMAYNRLKLEEEYKSVQLRRQEASFGDMFNAITTTAPEDTNHHHSNNSSEIYWEPNLINVIDSLDKMSFTRVTFAMESLLRKPETLHLVVFPMHMYTEMLSYLRILLLSSNEGHHEIAIGALYRLFYISTGQSDPLPKLLAAWKPNAFPKAHLFQLVEVIYQTLKTLEAAKNIFVSQGIHSEDAWKQKRKQLKKNGKKEIDMEMYLLSCLRFNVDDYFKRLVSNHSVSMYMRLLQRAETNDAVVNHRIYAFLQRMCSFQLDNNLNAPSNNLYSSQNLGLGLGLGEDSQEQAMHLALQRSQSDSSSNNNNTNTNSNNNSAAHLGYLLYNVQCLQTMHIVLSDDRLTRIDHLQPLIRLLRQIVRGFSEAALQNHLLFVEALFHHPHAHDHCLQLHSVYEADQVAQQVLSGHYNLNSKNDHANAKSSSSHKSKSKGYHANTGSEEEEEDDGSEDYDENDDSSDSNEKNKSSNKEQKETEEERKARKARKLREKQERRQLRKMKRAGLSNLINNNSNGNNSNTTMMALSDTDDDDNDHKKKQDSAAAAAAAIDEEDGEQEFDDTILEQQRQAYLDSKKKNKKQRPTNNNGGNKKKRLLKKKEDIWDSSASDLDSGDDAKKQQKTTANIKHKSSGSSGLEGSEDDAHSESGRSVDSADTATKTKRLLAAESRRTRKTWTKAEDDVLKVLYRRYQGMAAVYVAIAMSDEMRDLGSERNEQQIKHRIQYLRLDETLADNNDSDQNRMDTDNDSSDHEDSLKKKNNNNDKRNKNAKVQKLKRSSAHTINTNHENNSNSSNRNSNDMRSATSPEGLTSAEKLDHPSSDSDDDVNDRGDDHKKEDLDWLVNNHNNDNSNIDNDFTAATNNTNKKRPFDDYEFDTVNTANTTNTNNNAVSVNHNSKKRRLITNKSKRIHDNNSSDNEDSRNDNSNDNSSNDEDSSLLGEQTDTAPQQPYSSSSSQQQLQQQQRPSVIDIARGNLNHHNSDSRQTATTAVRTINLTNKENLKRLLDSDEEDEKEEAQ